MILLDRPYVSEHLKNTIKENEFHIVETNDLKELGIDTSFPIVSEEEAVTQFRSSNNELIYTNSENTLDWICQNLSFSDLPEKIDLFKNKLKFRTLVEPLYQDFFFKGVSISEIDTLEIDDFPLPFIIKPAVGFFSMGVHVVDSKEKWHQVRENIASEVEALKGLYPDRVFNAESFIIEQCILGEEFAVDAYVNSVGELVIVGIFQHLFSDGEDVSDRVYISSKNIIESNLDEFRALLQKVGSLAEIKNFPMHAEIRRTSSGELQFIEINPMRFGGWCTTADFTSMAYGMNPYQAYFSQTKPNWPQLLKDKEGLIYSIIVLDNSTGVPGSKITSFNSEDLLARFEQPIEFRAVDYKEYPVFGFLFCEIKESDLSSIDYILKSNLKEYISIE